MNNINDVRLVGTLTNVSISKFTLLGNEYCFIRLKVIRQSVNGGEETEHVWIKLYNGLVRLIKQGVVRHGDTLEIIGSVKSYGRKTNVVASKITRLPAIW